MNAKDLIIAIKTVFDGKGAAEAKAQLESTGRQIETTGKQTEGLGKAVGGTAARMEALGKVMRGLGVVGVIGVAVAAFEALRERITRSKTEAESLAIKTKEANDVKLVEAAISAYDRLKLKLAEVNQQLSRRAELEALALGGGRAVADARSASDESAEIAALDPGDPERAQKEAVVRARYSRQRSVTAATRKREDAFLQRKQLDLQAGDDETAAAAREAALPDLRKRQAAAASSASELESRSKAARRYKWDVTGGQLVDTPQSQDLAAASKSAADSASKLATAVADAEKEIRSLRSGAEHARKKAAASISAYKAADIEVATADRAGATDMGKADLALKSAVSKRVGEEQSKLADWVVKQESDRDRATRGSAARSELSSAQDAYDAARGSSGRAPARPASLRSSWGADGRIATAADLDRQADEAAQAGRRAVEAAARRLVLAAENFKRLEAELKGERGAD